MTMQLLWCLLFFLAALWAWKKQTAAALPLLAALPAYVLRTSLFGFPSTLLEAVLLGSVVGFFGKQLLTNHFTQTARDIRNIPFFWPALSLLCISIAAVLIAPDTRAALGVWRAYFLEPLLVLPLCFRTLQNKTTRQWTFRILAAEVCCLAIIAVLQKIGVLAIIEPWTLERRATGIYPFPNALGLFVGPLITFLATLAASQAQQARDRWLFGLAACAGVVAILASETEGAIGAVAFSLMVLGILSSRRVRQATIVAVCAVLLIIAAMAPVRAKLVQTLTFQDWSGTVRRVMWKETVEMLKTRPLFGAGLSGYKNAVAPFHKDPKVEIFQYPHTLLLNIWTELGALGIMVCGWTLFIFVTLLRIRKKDPTRTLHLAAALGVLAMLIHGLVDVPYFKNDLAVLTWFLLLIPAAIKNHPTAMGDFSKPNG